MPSQCCSLTLIINTTMPKTALQHAEYSDNIGQGKTNKTGNHSLWRNVSLFWYQIFVFHSPTHKSLSQLIYISFELSKTLPVNSHFCSLERSTVRDWTYGHSPVRLLIASLIIRWSSVYIPRGNKAWKILWNWSNREGMAFIRCGQPLGIFDVGTALISYVAICGTKLTISLMILGSLRAKSSESVRGTWLLRDVFILKGKIYANKSSHSCIDGFHFAGKQSFWFNETK